MKLFSQFVTFTDLQKDHRVAEMFTLQKMPSLNLNHLRQQKIDHVIYISRPDLEKVDKIVTHFSTSFDLPSSSHQKFLKGGEFPRFHLFFVPRSSTFGESKLKESDILMKFTSIIDLPIYMFNWDADVLNMENERAFSDILINGGTSDCLFDMSKALQQLRYLLGPFGEIFYKGEGSKIIYDLYNRWNESSKKDNDQETSAKFKIDRLLILDRSIDLITPLITQLTYEGLIDEYFEVKCGASRFPSEKFSTVEDQPGQSSKKSLNFKELQTNSSDEMYNELRNLNFNAIGVNLSKKLKQLAEMKTQIQSASTVRECKDFVKKIPLLKAAEALAANHVTVAEILKEKTCESIFLDTVNCEQEILNLVDIDRPLPFIEDLSLKGEHLNKDEFFFTSSQVLRLICLHAQICDGLKKKLLDQYRREFLHSFGYSNLKLLCNLQRMNILKVNSSSSTRKFEQLKKEHRLIVEGVNEQSPEDLSYVYSGYAPLLIRFCEQIQKRNVDFEQILESLKKLPGGVFGGELHPKYEKKTGDKNITLVVFVGGATYTEISALRFLSEKNEVLMDSLK
uniref:Vacuolar protein sorting-associated protein 33A n=1 Tax=Romanomermis culicivorax TaxID=13658 RepID=A0A915IKD1_ROMCU